MYLENMVIHRLNDEICFKPIGYVIEGIPRKGDPRRKLISSKYDFISRIRVFNEYKDCLAGLDGFSHIIVIWYAHVSINKPHLVRPMGRSDMPLVGVFATRSANRPNPICISVVELEYIKEEELGVRGLDAWTGTPLLDIKPYTYYDIIRRPKVSDWFLKYWKEKSSKLNYREKYPLLGPESIT